MLQQVIKRELRRLTSRKIYIFIMLIVPLGCGFFFLNMMNEGLPLKIPVGVIDLDHSSMSRKVTRTLSASEMIDITFQPQSFNEALSEVKSGKLYGFFMIPTDFQQKVIDGEQPTLSFYSNMMFFIPGTLSYKGFKTVAVTTSGGVVKTTLVGMGANEETVGSLLQPLAIDTHPLNNPWSSYSIYLNQSFIPCLLALMILLTTVFSICDEIKHSTSPQWMRLSRGNIAIALAGKLLPQTVIFAAVGIALQSIMFGFLHLPLNCHPLAMISAMLLLVMATQAFALIIVEIIPNLRLALSTASLIGILCFSIAGFSFPVENMYGGVAIFSYIVPIRYYFLIYVDQALNGIPLYYSRLYYAVLLGFILLPALGLRRLAGKLTNPIYVP